MLPLRATREIVLPHAQAFDALGMDAALLTTLGLAAIAVQGLHTLRVDKEGHGREHLADDIDVSRTVGWFTIMYPLELRLTNDPPTCLHRTQAMLEAFPPSAGFSYFRQHHTTHVASAFLLNYLGEGHTWDHAMTQQQKHKQQEEHQQELLVVRITHMNL